MRQRSGGEDRWGQIERMGIGWDAHLRFSQLASKENGVVTIATVNMPIALAVAATTGAAPLPVPPPIPA